MPIKRLNKRRYKSVPGTVIQCQSGRYLAYYEHRTDIIANGNNEIEAKKNLKKMYEVVIKHEKDEEEKESVDPTPSLKAKKFVEKLFPV